MRIVHRFLLRTREEYRVQLQDLGLEIPEGIRMPGGKVPLAPVLVAEDHPTWDEISKLMREWGAVETVSTKFSQREVRDALWLEIGAMPNGYPQPEERFGYLELTYDLTEYCTECGTGQRQKAPFQMKGEPNWGKRGIMELNWVYDELFVRPEVWRTVFEPFGVSCRPVLDTAGRELRTVVQLVIEEEISVDTSQLESVTCPACGRNKYVHVTRGFSPPLHSGPVSAMARTEEWFGRDHQGFKTILISQAVHKKLIDPKVKGAWYRPGAVSKGPGRR